MSPWLEKGSAYEITRLDVRSRSELNSTAGH